MDILPDSRIKVRFSVSVSIVPLNRLKSAVFWKLSRAYLGPYFLVPSEKGRENYVSWLPNRGSKKVFDNTFEAHYFSGEFWK
jgi:hypothetical protein